MRSRFVLFMAALLLGTSLQAQATVLTFNNSAQWSGAVKGSIATDSFDDLPVFERVVGPAARQLGATGYRASVVNLSGIDDVAAEDFFTLDGGAGNTWLSTNFAQNAIRFDQFGGRVRGIGGYFFATDLDGAALTGRTMVLTLFDGAGMVETLIQGGLDSFFGFASDRDIVALSLRVLGDASAFATVDGLSVAVPEPASVALLALGLMLIAARRRI